MTYIEAIEYFHSFLQFGINPGLERIEALCKRLGNPQNELKFIHVAGTNGKGSTSTMISEILIHAGYKVGLFTSPYVVDFRERIQINGLMIKKEELIRIANKIKSAVDTLTHEGIQPTEFEVITAAAFLYFAENKCDVVVLEVGLGGRFDSTNIIKTPLLSIITSISLDHMNILGSTISQITSEKCGIIKDGGITVCYPEQLDDALQIIARTVKLKNNELIVPKLGDIKIIDESIKGTKAEINGIELTIPLIGEHMVKNCSVAVAAVRALNKVGLKIMDSDIVAGVANTRIAARMEVFQDKNLVLLDGGHNEGCAKALDECIKKYLIGKRIISVIGMMKDKDYKRYMSIVVTNFSKVIATKPHNSRSLDAQTLAESASEFCSDCVCIEEPTDAVNYAKNVACVDDVIIVCGSFYLASEVRKNLKTANLQKNQHTCFPKKF